VLLPAIAYNIIILIANYCNILNEILNLSMIMCLIHIDANITHYQAIN